jgi:hypothetical protein
MQMATSRQRSGVFFAKSSTLIAIQNVGVSLPTRDAFSPPLPKDTPTLVISTS